MVELETYYATDRRVYNGAPCSDMQREWNRTDALDKRMKEADPTAGCTYFPVEDKYMVFHYPDPERAPQAITGFHACKQTALIEAIKILEAM